MTSSARTVILVVEDDAAINSLYRDFLAFDGFLVLSAQTAREALTVARDCRPDLVLVDLMLPEVDGLTLAGQLRQDERTRDAHLVAITAHNCQAVERRAHDVGFEAYLTKPCSRDDLLATVCRLLQREPAILPRWPAIR